MPGLRVIGKGFEQQDLGGLAQQTPQEHLATKLWFLSDLRIKLLRYPVPLHSSKNGPPNKQQTTDIQYGVVRAKKLSSTVQLSAVCRGTHGAKHDGHPQLGLLEEDLHEGGQHAHLLGEVIGVDLEVHQPLDALGVVPEPPVVLRLHEFVAFGSA